MTTAFNQQCKGLKACTVSFKLSSLPTSKCYLPMATGANWQYALIATCKDETIKILGKDL